METTPTPLAAKRSWERRPGDRLDGGLEVVEVLGGGGRTEVLRCRDRATGRTVVVKTLRPGRTGTTDQAALAREATTLRALDHHGVPGLVGSRLGAEPAHLLLQDVGGVRLSTRRRRSGPLDADEALRVAGDIADALAHLHGRGYVHLDVKPANIVLGDGRAILLDLGSARDPATAARLRPGGGTVSYRSPEQTDPVRFGAATAASDVFSLGVTLLRSTTGRNPLRARRDPDPPDDARLVRRCHGAVRHAPPSLRRLIVACTALDPTRRPDAGEVRRRVSSSRTNGRAVVYRQPSGQLVSSTSP